MKEQEIIELLISKKEQGMNELLVHYGPLMRYIIAPILLNVHDQEDCLSEVAMQVWKNVDKFDCQRGSWNVWLTALVRNYALNYKRNIAMYQKKEEISPDIPSPDLSPEEQVIQREREHALSRAMSQLSQKDRALFYRKYYYMQSIAQIASEMCMTERAVEGKLYRIKKRLRKILGGEGYEES